MFLAIDSKNEKLVGSPRRGFVAALALPIKETCPDSCTLKTSGECYAQGGRVAIHVRRLERTNAGRTVDAIAKDAANEIRGAATMGLASGRALRLFTSGDARTESAAKTIASAARTWIAKGGRAAYGYTHAWRSVQRSAWRGVSMLASVDTSATASEAVKRGYAPALVVASHPSNGRAYKADGVTWIPCPEQTRGVPCVACGLCFDADALHARNAGIAFAAHGVKVNALKRRLTVIQTGKERAA